MLEEALLLLLAICFTVTMSTLLAVIKVSDCDRNRFSPKSVDGISHLDLWEELHTVKASGKTSRHF